MKNEKGSLTCQRYIRGSQSVLCCQRFKKIKTNKRGQEEDILCAMKYPPNSKLLQHTHIKVNHLYIVSPLYPSPLTFTFSVSGEPEKLSWCAGKVGRALAGVADSEFCESGRDAEQTCGEQRSVLLALSVLGTQSCFPLGVCRKHKVVMPKVVLSVKQPVNCILFLRTRCFILLFMGNQGKSTLQFIQMFNCCGSFYVC